MRFVEDSSDALNMILTQRYVCDSFGVECGWCNAVQSAVVVKDLADCKKIFMNRTEQEDGRASGWYALIMIIEREKRKVLSKARLKSCLPSFPGRARR